MSFKIDPKQTGSLNDGGRKLKVGTFAYKITGAKLAPVKSDPTGKEQQIIFDLETQDGYACKTYLSVMSKNDDVRAIAEKTLVAFADAAGITGILKPERLKSFLNKVVVIEAVETKGKGDKKDNTYVNIRTVEAPDDDAAEESEETEEEESEEEEEPEEEAEEEEEEEAEPAPKAKTKLAAGKAAPAKSRPW